VKPAPDQRSLRLYLLGILPGPEAEALEDDCFAGGPHFEELLLAEDDLIDDYVAGRLTSHEAQAFEAAFLDSPRRRERVQFARALRQAGSAAPLPARRAAWPGFLAAAAVVASLTLAGWVVLRLRGAEARLEASHGQLQALQSEVERLRDASARLAEDLDAVARPVGGVLSFALGPGLSRGDSTQRPLVLSPGAEWVRLRFPAAVAGAHTVEVQTPEGRVVWFQAAQGSASDGSAASVMVPARVLKPGTYVAVARRQDGTEVATFPLRVVSGR
jgi:hypothetical protein